MSRQRNGFDPRGAAAALAVILAAVTIWWLVRPSQAVTIKIDLPPVERAR